VYRLQYTCTEKCAGVDLGLGPRLITSIYSTRLKW